MGPFLRDGAPRRDGGARGLLRTRRALARSITDWAGAHGGLRPVAPPPTPTRPQFDALTYDLDTFLPVIDLGQERTWTADSGGSVLARFVSVYSVVHILGGWIVATVLLGWFIGLTRRQ